MSGQGIGKGSTSIVDDSPVLRSMLLWTKHGRSGLCVQTGGAKGTHWSAANRKIRTRAMGLPMLAVLTEQLHLWTGPAHSDARWILQRGVKRWVRASAATTAENNKPQA